MKKTLFSIGAALALTMTASPALAADRDESDRYRIEQPRGVTRSDVMKWEAAFLVLSAADLAITVRCLERNECEEMNPVFGKHPKTSTLVLGKLVGGAIHFTAIDYISRRDPKLALRLAQISVVVQGGVVGFNLSSEF
jgi:hypothetical protein